MYLDALSDWIYTRAKEIGFNRIGITIAEPMNSEPFRAWLDAGYGAEMAYLHRHLPVRGHLDTLLPGARSVICVALAYPGIIPGESALGAVARYARSEDYHDVVTRLLTQLWSEILARSPQGEGRIFVDGGPLPERELARRAGLGWPGKHGCLIASDLGTRFVLGEILTTLPLSPDSPATGTCGDCRRCLDVCPTGALVEPGIVDARRCLSYLTIEHKGPIPRELRPLLGTRLFGCDSCQDACPYNAKCTRVASPFEPAADLIHPDLRALLRLSPVEFRQRFRGTPLARTKRRGLLRNACIALGNTGDPAAIPALCGALRDEEPLVRGHAAWALGRLGALERLAEVLAGEGDAWVRDEMVMAINEIGRPDSWGARAETCHEWRL